MRIEIVPTGRVVEHLEGKPLERVSIRTVRSRDTMCSDTEIKVWNSREVMARAIRMQEGRAHSPWDWRAWVPLTTGEGF
jgi:hypothetical protein